MDIGQVEDESWEQWGQEQQWDEQQGEINSFSFGSGQAGWICEVSRNSEKSLKTMKKRTQGSSQSKAREGKENKQSPPSHRLCGQRQDY